MTSARYGRMRLGSCVEEDLGHLGCFKDVMPILDAQCSGRHSCSVSVPNAALDETKPCSELQSYLEASYRCLKGECWSPATITPPLAGCGLSTSIDVLYPVRGRDMLLPA